MEESRESVKADLNLTIKREFDSLGFEKTPNVTSPIVHNVYDAVSAITFDRAVDAPHWRTEREQLASELLLFKNGLLHVPSYLKGYDGYFVDPTPEYFALAKLPYKFDEHAPEPKAFLKYCDFQWTDADNHLLLEEILGDILLADPRLRVFYCLLGAPWAGKSALAETMENLVGPQNRCAVDLHDFATTFGLESTLGKKLILVSEAGVDVRSSSAIVEKIKKITGNDLISINRKNKTSLSVRLGTKIVVVSNHLIQLADGSGALFDRLIPLQFLRSIPKDDRDKDFPVKQLAELPGIVLLALRGWKRLNENRQFTLPNSSKTVLNEMRETGSPVLMFIEEMCRLEKDGFTPTDTLWNGWKHFCGEHDIAVSEQSEFIFALRSAAPALQKDRKRNGKKNPIRGFTGIRMVAN